MNDTIVPARLPRSVWEAEWKARTAWAASQVHDVVSAEYRLSDVREWLVDIELRCPRCEAEGRARFVLPTFVEFAKQMKGGNVKCECGAAFGSKESRIVLL